jgi:hypothetical protein
MGTHYCKLTTVRLRCFLLSVSTYLCHQPLNRTPNKQCYREWRFAFKITLRISQFNFTIDLLMWNVCGFFSVSSVLRSLRSRPMLLRFFFQLYRIFWKFPELSVKITILSSVISWASNWNLLCVRETSGSHGGEYCRILPEFTAQHPRRQSYSCYCYRLCSLYRHSVFVLALLPCVLVQHTHPFEMNFGFRFRIASPPLYSPYFVIGQFTL